MRVTLGLGLLLRESSTHRPAPYIHISTTIGRRPAGHNLRQFGTSGVLVLRPK
ncbi:hypothetical protein BDR07DRAFT_1429256 [Suillus spraguei]|nr:hypothetical protein BDR07DRAFT_1429256 [Suillus spraguei]